MNWKFFSGRRGISLEIFLAGVESYDAAVDLFSKKGISLPENDQLRKFFAAKKKSLKVEKSAPVEQTHSAPVEEVEVLKPRSPKGSQKKSSSHTKNNVDTTK